MTGYVTEARRHTDFTRRASLLALVAALAWAALHGTAAARPYTVYACDAAGFWGHANNSWAPLGPGTIESRCPSNGDPQRGMTTRLVGSTFGGFTASIYDFFAPPGTTITAIRWSGRLARNNCSWVAVIAAYPANATVLGVPSNQFCGTNEFDVGSSILRFPVPSGTTHLRQMVACGAPSCHPGATFHSRYMEVNLEDGWVPNVGVSGALAEGRWVSGAQVAHVYASDNVGVRRIEGSVGATTSSPQEFPCSPTFVTPCATSRSAALQFATSQLPDGEHTLSVTATDAAGHPSTVHRRVRVDNTPPDPILPAVAGGDGWRTTNEFTLHWSSPQPEHAPVTATHWEVCSENRCTQGVRAGDGGGELRRLVLVNPGDHTARVWLEDAAGNARKEAAVAAVHLRYDPVAPSVTFAPPDASDPLRVGVTATDRHSGVAGGDIEIRRVGTTAWHGLPTTLDGGELVAYVDDERFRRGSYEFRARAVDQAGNEASVGPADASSSTLRLPVRAGTRLKAGIRRVTLRRRVVGEGQRKRIIRRRVVSFDKRVRIRAGRRVTLGGQLTNHDGQPLAHATVDVFDATVPGTPRLLATVQTSGQGSLAYRFRAKRNRVLRFRYGGSRRIAPAEATVRVDVPASSSIRVSRSTVLNGESVLFRGRVGTGPLPPAGKLIEIQAHFRSRFRTFSTVRTDRRGRWHFRYQFGGTVGRVRYRFRVLLPAEGGYPFASGASRVIRVLVIGL